MFCCHGFTNLINSAGNRGISAVIQKDQKKFRFFLQSRGIDFADQSKIVPNPKGGDYMINLCNTACIHFCPSCGKKLQELAELYSDEFEIIAQKHSKFLPNE